MSSEIFKHDLSKIQRKEPDDANQIILIFFGLDNDQNQLTFIHLC